MSSNLKFIVVIKFNIFRSDLILDIRHKFQYFLEFTTKNDLVAQIKRFENVNKNKKVEVKKRKKKKFKSFDTKNFKNSKNLKYKLKNNNKNDQKENSKDNIDKNNFNRILVSEESRLFR